MLEATLIEKGGQAQGKHSATLLVGGLLRVVPYI
ncbi:MAG: hypothetical protein AVDCRST_MAG26-2236 [uncultured Chloroflexia bacterium]|uniref:Uncharacterized protein n=1 Tax=uncultured Chloroflexia bacterium TaxID=1672391 RepID=A0A6J4IRJ5_9CHLR|nr:MAG: hypothetical protein AVDCRST_MAG26-2236 [uncultured Chloroflexia bacterium]